MWYVSMFPRDIDNWNIVILQSWIVVLHLIGKQNISPALLHMSKSLKFIINKRLNNSMHTHCL